ncbi:MAG: hypothetical protein AAB914_03460 [Patescibacteria group bacterium]
MSDPKRDKLGYELAELVPARCDGCPVLGDIVREAVDLEDRIQWHKTPDAFCITRLAVYEALSGCEPTYHYSESEGEITTSEVFEKAYGSTVEDATSEYEEIMGAEASDAIRKKPEDIDALDDMVVILLNSLAIACGEKLDNKIDRFRQQITECANRTDRTDGLDCTVS